MSLHIGEKRMFAYIRVTVVDMELNFLMQELQKGKIGVTVNCFWFLPYDNTSEGVKAKDRAFDYMLGW